MIRLPGIKNGKRIQAIVQPWDVTATILDMFGIAKPSELIGESLMPLMLGQKSSIRDTAICGTNALAQAMTDRWLYTVWRSQRKPSLIDLEEDSRAEVNVLDKHPECVKWLHGEITQFMRKQNISEDFIASFSAPEN
jgi:arylsulfatase A-like enzyme